MDFNGFLPAWVITLISLACSTFITTIIGLLIKNYFTKYIKKKEEEQIKRDKDRLELEEFREQKHREERKEDVLKNISILLKPLETKIDNIENNLVLDKAATVTNMRSTLKALRDKYKTQGYADSGDKATWIELYNNYKDMGGNHFKEYVDEWKSEVESLPVEKIIKRKKSVDK